METMRGKIIQCKRKLYISMLRFSKLRSQRFCMYVTGELRVIEKAGIEDKKHQATLIKCTQQTWTIWDFFNNSCMGEKQFELVLVFDKWKRLFSQPSFGNKI